MIEYKTQNVTIQGYFWICDFCGREACMRISQRQSKDGRRQIATPDTHGWTLVGPEVRPQVLCPKCD